jgi:putative pyruvate formate lyase activating enzyme
LELEISSAHPHFGEEKPLVGDGGSGTVFLTHCNLKCVFCINWDISHGGEGRRSSIDEFADIMLELQKTGCSNINIVTPSHYSPHIFLALDLAASKGLTLPLVYNTCGWETTAVLGLLDGIVDIYLADFKYFNNKNASRYSSGAESYPEITQKALKEMNRQVGVAKPAADNLMKKGLMVRHLVMPDDVSGSKKVVDWMAKNLPKDTYLNLMSQYSPYYKAMDYPHISRKITRKEYVEVIQHAKEVGLTNLEIQGYFN